MRWKYGRPGDTVIVTFNGRPGACAAAAVLLKNPDAGIYISSSYHLARCLESIARHDSVKNVHICGMGFKGTMMDLTAALKNLREQGVTVNWYSGSYWNIDKIEKHVGNLCNAFFDEDSPFDTQVVVKQLELQDNPKSRLLLKLSDLDAKPAGLGKELAELVEAGKFRYFQFGDLDSYPQAIRTLAEQYPLSPEERDVIKRFRAAGRSEGLDGASPAIKRIKANLHKYGRLSRTNILIMGETGTGKERVARLLHFASPRATEPFFCENCATLSSTGLINSRLFGHVKGAFTGAVSDSPGIMDAADGGVLFLDEIGEMPMDTQAMLLRVIEQGTYTPVGSIEERKADVRIISATNCDLSRMVAGKKFRADLFFRLAALVIKIPPLRNRKEDIPYLTGSIRRELEKKHGMQLPHLSKEQEELLKDYEWPGNVRQLYNVLQKAWTLEMLDDLKDIIDEQREYLGPFRNEDYEYNAFRPGGLYITSEFKRPDDVATVEEVVSEYSRKALETFDGNKTRTAKALGISVNTLNKKLQFGE